MTELNLLVAFFVHLSLDCRYKGHDLDVKFLKRIATYLTDNPSDTSYFENIIAGFCQLDDAIVTGLSEGRFVFRHPSFAVYRQSDCPRFLYGLLSRVFYDNGNVRELYDANAVEICLQGLRLVRRAKSSSLAKKAENKAVEKFVSYQSRERPGHLPTLDLLADLWVELEGESFHESTRLGKPGNGVCNDMRFPYVPDLCFPDVEPTNDKKLPENVRYFLTKARDDQFRKAGFTRGKLGWIIPDPDYIGLYYPIDHTVAKLAVVPKKYNEGRAITTTTVFATILGATLRETIFQRVRELGAINMINVHDQTKSHKVLEDHFFSVACLDLEGGSTCFTTKNLDRILSKTEYIGDCWKSSRPSKFSYRDEIFDLNTLTMGDASSVALLSCTLFLSLVLAYKRFHDISDTPLKQVIRLMEADGRFRVVGDDIICPDYLLDTVLSILSEMAVTVNTRKSSKGSSLHKESCGAWFIVDYVNKSRIRRIFPFRAAVPDSMDFGSITTVIEQYCNKVGESQLAYTAYRAHITVLLPLDQRIRYDNLKSFSPSFVGTRFGRQWSTVHRACKPGQQVIIDDSLAYICNIRDSLVTPRYTRVTQPPRLKHRTKRVDVTYRPSITRHLLTLFFLHEGYTRLFLGSTGYTKTSPPRYRYVAWENPAIKPLGQRKRWSSSSLEA